METDNNEMERLYAETFSRSRGDARRVVSVRNDGVLIDIGYKSEGFIPAEEFTSGEFTALKAGDVIDVYVVDVQNAEGVATLSKEKATKHKAWETIESAFESGAPVQGIVSGKTKGGFHVDLMGTSAFMPSSQTDARSIRESDNLVGRTIQVRVLKLNNKRSNIIVSRKAILDEERLRKKMEILPSSLKVQARRHCKEYYRLQWFLWTSGITACFIYQIYQQDNPSFRVLCLRRFDRGYCPEIRQRARQGDSRLQTESQSGTAEEKYPVNSC